ncbi:MAG: Maff2 family protein [Defluviitaleaceae bacterium]|nr:Maff2 family protein [Defluviitaleaceae bacterium]
MSFLTNLLNNPIVAGMTLNPDLGSEIWEQVVTILQVIVIGGGAVLAIFGVIKLFDGQGDGDGSKVSQGRWQIIGGAGIIAVGFLVIPMLENIF